MSLKLDERLKQLEEQGYDKKDAIELLKLQVKLSDVKDKEDKDALDDKKIERLVKEIVDKSIEGQKAPQDKKDTPYPDADDNEMSQIKGDIWMVGQLMRKHPRELNPEAIKSAFANNQHRKIKLDSIKKALDTTDASAIVPTELSRQMLADVEKASVILSNLRVMDIPEANYEMPYRSSSVTAYGVDESTGDSASAVKASDPGVSNISFTARKIGARALWSRELDEDAAIAILPFIREDFVRVTTDSWERAFIFGDTSTSSNINSHDDDTNVITTAGQKSYWLQADGLVHHCIDSHTDQANDVSGALSAADFLATRKLLGKYGDRPNDVLYIVDRTAMYDAMALDQCETLDKLGPNATILTGQLGSIYGSPVLVSDGLPETDDNGQISGTSSNNDNSAILAVNRRVGAIIGRRGELRIAVDTINKTDQYEGVVFSRYGIEIPYTQGVAYSYNIT